MMLVLAANVATLAAGLKLEAIASAAPKKKKHTGSLSNDPPKFTVQSLGGFQEWGPFPIDFLKQQVSYTADEDEADLVFAAQGKFTWKERFPSFLMELTPRHPSKPWVVWAHNIKLEKCGREINKKWCEYTFKMLKRMDILFVAYDLRDFLVVNDKIDQLRGVTFPPFGSFRRATPSPETLAFSTKYRLTFRGDAHPGWFNSSSARPNLKRAFAHNTDPSVVVEFAADRCPQCGYSHEEQERYDDLLQNTSFALVPHGDGRWESRFSEVVDACAIPVVMADGLTLPFAEVLDWAGAIVVIHEDVATDAQALLALLPSNRTLIEQMRKRVCFIQEQYFATNTTKFTTMLLALRMHLRMHRKPMFLPCPPLAAYATGNIVERPSLDAETKLDMVHIVYSSNRNGFAGLLNSMASLTRHLSQPQKTTIHVIVPKKDLTGAEDVLACFRREPDVADGIKGLGMPTVVVHEMLPQPPLPSVMDYPPEAFVRLYLHKYLPEAPRALWVDIDTIVQADVRPLYQRHLDNMLASTLDGGLDNLQKDSVNWSEWPAVHVGLMNLTFKDWLNTGVLLFDLEKWKATGATAKVEDAISAMSGWSADQLGFSLAFKGNVDLMDWRWNIHGLSDDFLDEKCSEEGRIVHWTGYAGGKPWQKGHWPYNDKFYKGYLPQHRCDALANVSAPSVPTEILRLGLKLIAH